MEEILSDTLKEDVTLTGEMVQHEKEVTQERNDRIQKIHYAKAPGHDGNAVVELI